MIRENAFGLAAVVAAVFSIGGALAIVQAQQPAGGPPATKATGKKSAASGSSPGRNGGMPGVRSGMGIPAGMPAAGTSGMGMGMGSMSMGGMPVDDDPEMTELAQIEDALSYEADEIIARYAETEDPAERKTIAAELKETLTKQFDVQRQRRELELGRIEERVKKLREQIKRRNDARDTIIGRRLDQLVTEAEGLGWAQPTGAAPRGQNFFNRRTGELMRSSIQTN